MTALLTETYVVQYPNQCVEIFHPDTGVRNIDDFVHRVDALSLPLLGEKVEIDEDDENYKDAANAFKGAMLEVFSEIFFGAFQHDPKVGVSQYRPVPLSEDYGVDAIGINVAGTPVAIQVKFRSNPSESIKYAELARTYTAGRIRHHIPLEGEDSLILLTTCNSVSKACNQVFRSTLRVISKNIIAQRVDNSASFWAEAEQRLAETLEKLGLLG
jgi:hypothetical protein